MTTVAVKKRRREDHSCGSNNQHETAAESSYVHIKEQANETIRMGKDEAHSTVEYRNTSF